MATTRSDYDNDAWFAEKIQRDMEELQANRVAHAQACGFVPQEGDICVNAPYAKYENYQEFSLFRYENGLWVYHTSMQVGMDRYLSQQGYTLVVKFGRYAEGYYSQHKLPTGKESLPCQWCGSPVTAGVERDGKLYCDMDCATWDAVLHQAGLR